MSEAATLLTEMDSEWRIRSGLYLKEARSLSMIMTDSIIKAIVMTDSIIKEMSDAKSTCLPLAHSVIWSSNR